MDRSISFWLAKHHPKDKMTFLAGPRQSGKTTVARHFLGSADSSLLLNWDSPVDRQRIQSNALLEERPIPRRIVFDELHKMKKFKSWLKGYFDTTRPLPQIWLTGSGRLDVYQKGGESLLGRYFLYRMHPLTAREILAPSVDIEKLGPESLLSRIESSTKEAPIDVLLRMGGFPEPFLKGQTRFHRQWVMHRRARVTHEDIRDLTRIEDLARLEYMVSLLVPRVGSLLSINSMREDLDVAFATARTWLRALERTYYIFTLEPYATRLARGLKKERKAYFWDWSEISTPAGRFKNFVASHLLRAVHAWSDFGFGAFDLRYLRDKERREVDFLVTRDGKPWLAVHVKSDDTTPNKALTYFGERIKCDHLIQVVETPGVFSLKEDVWVVSAGRFLRELP